MQNQHRLTGAGQGRTHRFYGGITAGGVLNMKQAGNDKINPVESVSLQYEKIIWRSVEGNIQYTDVRDQRPTA
ncbi:hypothetical protein GTPT_2591 [Tatumella ptyseos ATCC 33301]|uniref:Uncharacterized protein n=1 Tax=Tatumella ptyseos ATCC 33301 TaxID=1005995 RepID=A0A085JD55_9GAMM|nr:hypothetical protein GTPT_2591 [Tatumella ptyseos ATCC 33301]